MEKTGPVDIAVPVSENGQSNSEAAILLQNLDVAVYTCDSDGFIQLYNKAAAMLWGREPVPGKDLWCGSWKIYEPDGITPLPFDQSPIATTLKYGKEVEGREMVIERPDGSRSCIQTNPKPIFDANGILTGAINMLVDVTDSKVTEQKLATMAAIVQYSNDAIVSKTLEGIVTSWNKAAESLFGYSSEEMIGQSILKIIPPERSDEEPRILARLKAGELVDHFETQRLTKNGKLIDISLRISPIRNKHGKIIGASKIARDITEQKQIARQIRETEERFRMAAETTHLGTWVYDPEIYLLDCSEESRRICGIPDDIIPDFQMLISHIYEEDREDFINAVIDMLRSENGRFELEVRLNRYTDNELRWVSIKGKVFFDEEHRAERLIGTMLDITEEKEKEQKLKDSFEMFQTMADNVPAMIWMSGNDKFSDFFNKTWLNFRGRELEEESNEGWLEGVHPDDVNRCIQAYNAAFTQQKGFYSEYRLLRYDGQYRWISDNCVPRYSPSKEFLGFISACIDIDDQKRFREKIQDSELLFKTISNASPAGLWLTDADGQVIFVNDTWTRWTGIPLEKQLEDGWQSAIVEEDRAASREKIKYCHSLNKYYHDEFRFMRGDGELRWGFAEGDPYYDINGNFSGYAGSVTDITELKKLEQRKDDFIKMASHELKTPITSISGYVQLLLNIYEELDDVKLKAARNTVKSSLATISKQVSKLTRLISELLDLSRIESGKLELHYSEFDLPLLIEDTVQDVRYTTTRHAILLNNNFKGKIEADKDRIAQVLINLLTNAIKYSPDADHVEVFVNGDQEQVKISVKDYGIGIDKRDHSRIFDRFYRVEGKSEQTYPGFGIGLFIAGEIVHRHRGTISVESEKGKGTVFTVILPRRKQY